MIKVNDQVYTPRFCMVTIKEVFEDRATAWKEGYTEPSHYHANGYGILGKSLDLYCMEFAAVRER